VRKLLARFNPALWEDEPKAKKVSPLVFSLEEDLGELDLLCSAAPASHSEAIIKLADGMVKSAFRLESEGADDYIPIDQIRRAAYWSRLAPAGREKLLIIENADRTQEKARNSLLKLLEEPPEHTNIVLTTHRPGSLLPTILSRLRPYRFYAREAAVEAEVIRRVFRDKADAGIGAYLESFLPVSADTLNALAAFFAASAAYKAAQLFNKQSRGQGGQQAGQSRALAGEVILLGKYTAPKARAAGFENPRGEAGAVIPLILEKAEKFEVRSLFSRFLCGLLDQVTSSLKSAEAVDPSSLPAADKLPAVSYFELWKNRCAWAETAAGLYRLTPAQVLEKLFIDLSRGMAALQ
jgi:DNA polymerase-3 subunit gamma/tau